MTGYPLNFIEAVRAIASLQQGHNPLLGTSPPELLPFVGLPHQRRTETTTQGKCERLGHRYRNMGTAHDPDGNLYMVGKCTRCGQVHARIPAKRAETNLHPGATGKSRDHWLRPHIVDNWVYLDGKPAYHVSEHPKEHAA